MILKTLRLKNFRNHLDKSFEFEEKINMVTGPNGIGKTNILEAIHFTSTTKSPRTKYDRDLINYDKSFCFVQTGVLSEGEENALEVQVIKKGEYENASLKKAKLNKTPKAIYNFAGQLKTVLFTPESISLITGSPSKRRRYLDSVLLQTHNNYKRTLGQYKQAIRQRNKVLESLNESRFGKFKIDYWDDKILVLGKYIQETRGEFSDFLKLHLENKSSLLGENNSNLVFDYLKNTISKERIDKYKDKEILARTTLVGPHRDDFEIRFDNNPIAYFGSRGQQRTILLALKLVEKNFIEEKTKVSPILLLDDIFSELDNKHEKAVLDFIKGKQSIVTSTYKPNLISESNDIILE